MCVMQSLTAVVDALFHPVVPGSYVQSTKNGGEIDVCSTYAILTFGGRITHLAIGSIIDPLDCASTGRSGRLM
jgi:hypothetical protein